MADQQQKEPQNNKTEKAFKIPDSENPVDEGHQNTKDTSTSAQGNDEPQSKCQPEIAVNIPPINEQHQIDANGIAKRANIFTVLGIIINLGILVGTFFILLQTKRSVDVASSALKTAVDQFQTSNKPILQIVDVHLTDIEVDRMPSITYQIVNLGNYPVKVLSFKSITAPRTVTPKYEDLNRFADSSDNLVNSIIAKDIKADHYKAFHKKKVDEVLRRSFKVNDIFFISLDISSIKI